jgi:hypothetical protein
MKVMALACVAMIEKAMAYHGMVRPATMYFFIVFDPRPRQVP